MHFFMVFNIEKHVEAGQERKRKKDVKVVGYNGITKSYNEKCYRQCTFLFVRKGVGEVIGVII